MMMYGIAVLPHGDPFPVNKIETKCTVNEQLLHPVFVRADSNFKMDSTSSICHPTCNS